MRLKYLSVLVFLIFASPDFAASINRITLAELQSKANLIVMGKVTKLVKEGNQDHVTIMVDSYIKGKGKRDGYTFTLVTRGRLKDFDPELKKGDAGVFFLKIKGGHGEVEKAYWGSVAIFPNNHFYLTEEKENSV